MSVGPGKIPVSINQDALFVDLPGFETVNTAGVWSLGSSPWQQIPWDRRTSQRFPVFMIADYGLDTGEPTIRPVRFQIRARIGSSSDVAKAHVAITFSRESPWIVAPFLHGSQNFSSGVATILLEPTSPVTRRSTSGLTRCRSTSLYGTSTQVALINAYAWLGWEIYGATIGTSHIDALSAWEVWE
jgi:hypothetical protein